MAHARITGLDYDGALGLMEAYGVPAPKAGRMLRRVRAGGGVMGVACRAVVPGAGSVTVTRHADGFYVSQSAAGGHGRA
ncbi:MAG: hypothetical protein FWE15_20060 [Actinomycetia bacterium]|nr:hypothetical protein [Actinomycetes bacterium]